MAFVYRTRIWFDELDLLGVLHHSRYIYHLERAQKALFVQTMGIDSLDPLVAPDIYAMVRDVDIHYAIPVRNECDIQIVLRVDKVRAAGLTVAFEFRSADGLILHCHGKRTICRMDASTHRPAEWSPEFRRRYEKLLQKK
ncbi:MAG: thioesterase family protein [Puniceicoccales bacterium]|jgi:acyl-CoA thioester hydrolase|nr:thioesterase family protein [Puniceicoccales bacterium]